MLYMCLTTSVSKLRFIDGSCHTSKYLAWRMTSTSECDIDLSRLSTLPELPCFLPHSKVNLGGASNCFHPISLVISYCTWANQTLRNFFKLWLIVEKKFSLPWGVVESDFELGQASFRSFLHCQQDLELIQLFNVSWVSYFIICKMGLGMPILLFYVLKTK
jgi:hypothetical protein